VSRPEDDYTLDDLVAHEKGQTKLVAGFLVLAVLFFVGKRLSDGDSAPTSPSPPAQVTSTSR
jgi:hypothetical protein